ncbi:MAG: hypothetical protein IT541_16120 [Hyphomicrobiales bacterium]|nr:hypothetical protein [Hyphomicrobiales bacterium]
MLVTTAQLSAALGRPYEAVAGWRKSGHNRFGQKVGRDHIYTFEEAFRIAVASELVGWLGVADGFAAVQSTSLDEVIARLNNPKESSKPEDQVHEYLVVQRVVLNGNTLKPVEDISVGTFFRPIFDLGNGRIDHRFDISNSRSQLLLHSKDLAIITITLRPMMAIIDCQAIWSRLALGIEHISPADTSGDAD